MEKFLKLPIDGGTSQLVSVTGLIVVSQASTTTTTLSYKGGDILTITHASVSNDDFRDFIQNGINGALQTSWTKPVYAVIPPVAVESIALNVASLPA